VTLSSSEMVPNMC